MWNPLKKSQWIDDLEQIEGSVFAHSSEICLVRGWKFITYHMNSVAQVIRNILK